MSPS